MKERKSRLPYVAVACVVLLGIILLIVGIVLLVKSNQASKACKRSAESGGEVTPSTRCDYSDEAVRSGFKEFLQNVQDSYYEVFPSNIVFKRGVTVEDIKRIFKPFDPSPANLKNITDRAIELQKVINDKSINMANLKPREKKALFRVKHFLQFSFAIPYDVNYYAGDFLMGPNLFCWQPICNVGSQVRYALRYYQPREVEDLIVLRDKMALFNHTFTRYIQNLQYGIKAGMVRSTEECKAGLNSIKRTFFKVALNGPEGWYLENDYAQYCVPSSISSGLGSLPLSYVYKNGNNTGIKTTKELPTGEPLNGRETYKKIMPYFTTNDMSPDEVHDLGFKMLNKLYPEVLEIARAVTKESDNNTAKEKFIKRLNESDMYFVDDVIPQNESDTNAYNLCSTLEKAKVYCPNRWAAMQRWFDYSQMLMSTLDPKTVGMFHFNGYKHTVPNCPVEMRPSLNPSSGAQSYSRSTSKCPRPAYYNIPFFLDRPGPKYEELSVNAHEARPGHHTQVQGLVEHFRDTCGGEIGWLGSVTSYTAFTEGWALYAENPLIARDTDIYNQRPFAKYGMLKWQVWRALRLIVDTGLHYKNFSRQDALKLFADYAWDTSDGAQKEVTRYQSDPGQATAYMIGQLHIIKLRDYAKAKLKSKFNLKDFHFYLLAQGSSPLSYLQDSIETYVKCMLSNGKGEGCYDVLNPVAKDDTTAVMVEGVVDDVVWVDDPPEQPWPDDYI
ncbi:hypothetical protein QZH41_014887 [Actinostola sp. cb2023]|nr:hypothetical protein QZH41_014887 [Actinostola sp. cb2023]